MTIVARKMEITLPADLAIDAEVDIANRILDEFAQAATDVDALVIQ
jgi:hypothetical protein